MLLLDFQVARCRRVRGGEERGGGEEEREVEEETIIATIFEKFLKISGRCAWVGECTVFWQFWIGRDNKLWSAWMH